MKVLKKRFFAMLIDSLIMAVILLVLSKFGFIKEDARRIDYLWLLIVFPSRDIIFRNASIGKKLLGLRVYDTNWLAPNLIVLYKRSIATMTLSSGVAHKSKLIGDGNLISVFDFERDKLGTFVIDKNVYAKLKAEAETMNGDFCKNMTDLYNTYLRSIYMKEDS